MWRFGHMSAKTKQEPIDVSGSPLLARAYRITLQPSRPRVLRAGRCDAVDTGAQNGAPARGAP
jgi:hypothetical protein